MDAMCEEYVDVIAIGFGPANIALAVALRELSWTGSVLFIERATAPDWQGEMLIDGTDTQHNPLRDFVTPRNPRSEFGFLSFLQAQGRLFEFLNLESPFALRKDYAAYVRWVARHFDDQVSYGSKAIGIALEDRSKSQMQARPSYLVTTEDGRRFRARAVVVAPGRSPHIPDVFVQHLSRRIIHFTEYLSAISRWRLEGDLSSIAVVGGSQSAIEIVLDLHQRAPEVAVHSVQRGFGFQLKDTSPFSERAYFPEFVDTFFGCPPPRQEALRRELWRSNYSAVDHDVLLRLNQLMYEQLVDGREGVVLHTSSDVTGIRGGEHSISLALTDRNLGVTSHLAVDAVVLATGFRNFGHSENTEPQHPLLRHIAPLAEARPDGSIAVTRDYKVVSRPGGTALPPLYVNGLCESTHGFGDAGSFSLLSLRSWLIANSLVHDLAQPAESLTTEAA